jgi:hypothetical protein
MSDDFERAPGVFTLIAERPVFREIAEKHVEGSGGAS